MKVRAAAPLLGFWIAVGAFYALIVSAGHFGRWPSWSGFYDAQARALVNGHLHLLERPRAGLMALANPYDPLNIRYWRWDHSYYQGHLYLYWGMVPAFFAAAAKLMVENVFVGDNVLTFAFCITRLIAGTLLIREVARRAAPPPPRWAVALALLVFALANPTPFTLARAAVYEAAIMGGVAFTLIGLWLGHRSLHVDDTRAAGASLAAASLAFGLAGGSRLSLLPTSAALALLLALWHWRRARAGTRPRLGVAVAALAPAGAVMLTLLIINHLRFGDWTEFGRRYVMTSPRLFVSARFLLPNIYAYAIAPPDSSCVFPYLSAPWDAVRVSTPGWLPIDWPADFYAPEPSAGLILVAPFTCLALAAPVLALARWRLRRATTGTPGAPASRVPGRAWGPGSACSRWMTRGRWLSVALVIWLAGTAPLLIMNISSMRYENDFASAVMLVAIFAGWRLLAAPRSTGGRRAVAVAVAYGLLATATIAAGFLLGFRGYFDQFDRFNPELLSVLQRHLSVCATR